MYSPWMLINVVMIKSIISKSKFSDKTLAMFYGKNDELIHLRNHDVDLDVPLVVLHEI